MIDEEKGVCLETKVRGEAESQGRRPAIWYLTLAPRVRSTRFYGALLKRLFWKEKTKIEGKKQPEQTGEGRDDQL